MKKAPIQALLVIFDGFAACLRKVVQFPDRAFEAARASRQSVVLAFLAGVARACDGSLTAGGKNDASAVSIPQSVVRRRIERAFTPVHEHPAIERRTQQYQHKERSPCDS